MKKIYLELLKFLNVSIKLQVREISMNFPYFIEIADEMLWYKICKKNNLLYLIVQKDSCSQVSYYKTFYEHKIYIKNNTNLEVKEMMEKCNNKFFVLILF